MKKINLIPVIFALAVTILFMSCEANKYISVTIVDAITNQAIDSVLVKVNAGKNGDYNKSRDQGYSDASGKYETDIMIGCSFGCYDIYMEYSKDGYDNKKDFNIIKGEILLNPK